MNAICRLKMANIVGTLEQVVRLAISPDGYWMQLQCWWTSSLPDMPMFVVEDTDLDLKLVSLATVDDQKEMVTAKKYATIL